MKWTKTTPQNYESNGCIIFVTAQLVTPMNPAYQIE
jgi:hypothetical protein